MASFFSLTAPFFIHRMKAKNLKKKQGKEVEKTGKEEGGSGKVSNNLSSVRKSYKQENRAKRLREGTHGDSCETSAVAIGSGEI